MKTLTNLKTGIKKGDGTVYTYSDLIVSCLNHPPQGGFSPEVMEKRLRVLSVVKDADVDAVVSLEDEDAKTVKECVNTMRWSVIHEDIGTFTRKVRELF